MNFELESVVQELASVNRKFASGSIVNRGSLEFAISTAKHSKDWQEQLAYLVRALLCDHVFDDGNKRTAAAYIMSVLEIFKYRYDPFRIDQLVLRIAKNSIADVKKIREMIEHASSKNI